MAVLNTREKEVEIDELPPLSDSLEPLLQDAKQRELGVVQQQKN